MKYFYLAYGANNNNSVIYDKGTYYNDLLTITLGKVPTLNIK